MSGEKGDVSGESGDEIEFPKPKFLNNEETEKISPMQKGTIMHLCMKKLDFDKNYDLNEIKALVQSLVDNFFITKNEAECVNLQQILNFTKSKIWQELKTAKEFHKEEPFYINESVDGENVLVQGIIDLYYINKNDELVLLDYKTDFVKFGEEQILIDRHSPQLMVYKEALENALNRKVDKVYIYSTVLGKEIEVDFFEK